MDIRPFGQVTEPHPDEKRRLRWAVCAPPARAPFAPLFGAPLGGVCGPDPWQLPMWEEAFEKC